MTAHGHFHWNELMTHNAARARDFYAKSLGWTYDDMPMPGGAYTLIKSGDSLVGGMFPITDPQMSKMPEHWFAYIAVDDVDARLKKLKAAGGKVHREPFDVPGVGRIAIVEDVNGAMQGWMTPAETA